MAIAFDAVSGAGANSSTLSHTCTGSNLILFANIIGDLTTDNLTGVTYAGVAMTYGSKVQLPGDRWTYLYYLVNPTTGANNIVASGLTFCNLGGLSYTGVNQGALDSVTSISTTGNPAVLTTTVVASNCWLVDLEYGGTGKTAGAGTTIRGGSAAFNPSMFDSNGVVGTGAQSLTINFSASTAYVGIVASIAPFVPPTTNASFLLNMI